MNLSSCRNWLALITLLAATVPWLSALNDLPPPLPTEASSPGWQETPYDVSVLLGALVTFKCRTFLQHTSTSWTHNGRKVTHGSPKFAVSNDRQTATYGPVGVEDSGAIIGCEVTTMYGNLPSPPGKITIHSMPSYSTNKIQVAQAGKPYEFDFGYTAPLPPSLYRWYKNGKVFSGDGGRVTVDHTGITFTRILPTDAGQYMIKASIQSAVVTAVSTLQVALYKDGGYTQTASSSSLTLSTKLAVLVALNQTTPHIINKLTFKKPSPVSKFAQHVLEFFYLFKRPTISSRAGGRARVKTEDLLLTVAKLVGNSTNHLQLPHKEMERISESTNCIAAKRRPLCILQHLRFRSIDGTCNNFFYPLNGASERPFVRLLPANYEDGISEPVGLSQQRAGRSFEPPWPSARLISWKLVENLRATGSKRLTHMFMQWAQFVDHDLDIAPVFDEDSCGCEITPRCLPIEVKGEDTVFGSASSNNADCLPFSRSVPACSDKSVPRNQINDLTSYIDGSNVYGSTKKLADSLRLFSGGLLKEGGRQKTLKGNLPFQEETPDHSSLPFFVAGDERANEQLGLTIMHTIWMREHNRLARLLAKLNPCWDDERLYQESRKIVGAVQQVISYKEFLPLVFGNFYHLYVPHYRGYNPFVDATVPNAFAAAAYRFGHSLVRDQFDRLDQDFKPLDIGPLPLEQAFFNPIKYFESLGTDPILRGMTVVKSNPVDEFLNSVLTSKLFVEPGEDLGGDLASLNIQRARDHGLPSYRTWEKYCQHLFPEVKASFQARNAQEKFTKVYGSDGYKRGIDLWLGGLAENLLPGGQVGPTFACILGLTFSRLRDGDRFWYENPYVFTASQRLELKRSSLAKVICTNADDISSIQREVFQPGRPRVSCSSLPAINLQKWWDRRCRQKDRRRRRF